MKEADKNPLAKIKNIKKKSVNNYYVYLGPQNLPMETDLLFKSFFFKV